MMQVTGVSASNWRNFKSLDFPLESRLFIVGPNASGKSNLLDLFRFLGDVASPGGGLAAALQKRGGLSKVRSLFARNHDHGWVVLDFQLRDGQDTWRYRLAFHGEKGGAIGQLSPRNWWRRTATYCSSGPIPSTKRILSD